MGRGGSFGATEESAATGMQRAKRRDSRTEDRCWPALTSLRGWSAHPPGRVGAGSWGSGFGGQIPGRGLELAAWRQAEGASVPQLARRESGKNSGPVEESRDHCFGVQEGRGFLPHVPTEGRAPPKRAPETAVSCGYQLRPQRRAWSANAAAAATKNPVCKQRSLSTPTPNTLEPVQPATARVPWSRDNFPGRVHGAPQAVTTSHQPLPLQACSAFQLWLQYPSLLSTLHSELPNQPLL